MATELAWCSGGPCQPTSVLLAFGGVVQLVNQIRARATSNIRFQLSGGALLGDCAQHETTTTTTTNTNYSWILHQRFRLPKTILTTN